MHPHSCFKCLLSIHLRIFTQTGFTPGALPFRSTNCFQKFIPFSMSLSRSWKGSLNLMYSTANTYLGMLWLLSNLWTWGRKRSHNVLSTNIYFFPFGIVILFFWCGGHFSSRDCWVALQVATGWIFILCIFYLQTLCNILPWLNMVHRQLFCWL